MTSMGHHVRAQEQESLAAALTARYPVFARETVRRWVELEAGRYRGAPVQTFVPVLVARAVEVTLRDLAGEHCTRNGPLPVVDVTSPLLSGAPTVHRQRRGHVPV